MLFRYVMRFNYACSKIIRQYTDDYGQSVRVSSFKVAPQHREENSYWCPLISKAAVLNLFPTLLPSYTKHFPPHQQ